MNVQFTKATKEKAKLRLAIFGPSGSGKTFTALRMASGIGGKIAVIDTERGSASKYADRFNFDVLDLPKNDIETYVAAIGAANAAGYDVLIIDSLTHAWQDLLQEVDRIAKTRYKGNTWSAWSDGTPKQRALVDSLLNYSGHIIATMRSKTEWVTEAGNNGKSKPVRVGLAPEQGKGIEYEFDLLMEISVDHVAEIIKDRTGKFQDKIIDKPGEEFGKSLSEWLNDGNNPQPKPEPAPRPAIVDGEDPGQPKPEARPLSADGLRVALLKKVQSYANRKATEKQSKLFDSVWIYGSLFLDDRERHATTEWLFGFASSKQLTDAHKLAIIDWLTLEEINEDGKKKYLPSKDAIQEKGNAILAALKAQGQTAMDL